MSLKPFVINHCGLHRGGHSPLIDAPIQNIMKEFTKDPTKMNLESFLENLSSTSVQARPIDDTPEATCPNVLRVKKPLEFGQIA
jgi:hypothetical protein